MRNKNSLLLIGILIIFFVSGLFYYLGQRNSQQQPNIDQTTANPESQSLADTDGSPAGNSCTELTAMTTEGPYFVTGTRKLADNNLNHTNLPGTKIKVSGYVYAGIENTPIPNAKIELWQTDDAGSYHPNANGPASKYRDDQLALRGYVVSNADGYYEFTSIYPGYYEGRARHIHAKITADGYQDTITQILFEPKPSDGVTLENDSIAQALPPCHLLKMTKQDGLETGSIDFRLRSI